MKAKGVKRKGASEMEKREKSHASILSYQRRRARKMHMFSEMTH